MIPHGLIRQYHVRDAVGSELTPGDAAAVRRSPAAHEVLAADGTGVLLRDRGGRVGGANGAASTGERRGEIRDELEAWLTAQGVQV